MTMASILRLGTVLLACNAAVGGYSACVWEGEYSRHQWFTREGHNQCSRFKELQMPGAASTNNMETPLTLALSLSLSLSISFCLIIASDF